MGLNSIFCFLQDKSNNNPDRKLVRDFVDKNFHEEGTEFEDWDPIDWQQDISLYTMIRVRILMMNFNLHLMNYYIQKNSNFPVLLNNIFSQDPNYVEMAKSLHGKWKHLGRKIHDKVKHDPDKYSLIYLENPFVVPGGRFRECYYWDSYWTILGLLASNMTQTAKGE